MPSVTLDDLWVHLASDFDDSVTAAVTEIVERAELPLTRERYAGGRLRSISRPGETTDLTIRLELVNRDTVDQLREWIGVTVMVRDPRGRVVWGVYQALDITELPGADDDLVDVAFVLLQVAGSAEV